MNDENYCRLHDIYDCPYAHRVKPERRCGRCDKIIYYGLYCSNYCADKDFAAWKASREEDYGRGSDPAY